MGGATSYVFYCFLLKTNCSSSQNLQTTDAGWYTCRASNHLTRESHLSPNPINLIVLPEGELHKPRLLAEPEKEYHVVQV